MFLRKTKKKEIERENEHMRNMCCEEYRNLKQVIGSDYKTPAPVMLRPLPSSSRPVTAATFNKEKIRPIKEFYNYLFNQGKPRSRLTDFGLWLDIPVNPVFIRGDGTVMDADLADKMQELSITTPSTRVSFEAKEILPCNTIIYLMQELLNTLNGHLIPVENLVRDKSVQIKYTRLKADDIISLERYYECLPLTYKRLFNIVCRSPSGQILEDAVFLPNGLLYEKSEVLNWLAIAAQKKQACYIPGTLIAISADDITPCRFSKNILEQILTLITVFKYNRRGTYTEAKKIQEKFKVQLAPQTEMELLDLIECIDELTQSLTQMPTQIKMPTSFMGIIMQTIKPHNIVLLRQPRLLNTTMIEALDTAKLSLQSLDYRIARDFLRSNPDCTQVRAITNTYNKGIVSLASIMPLYNNRYAYYHHCHGGEYQPGWYVLIMLTRVDQLLRSLHSTVRAEEMVFRHDRHRSFG
jgi:hypothetical protein